MLKVPLQVVVNENRIYPVIVRSEKNKNRSKTPPEHSFALAAGSKGSSGWLSAQVCLSSPRWPCGWSRPGCYSSRLPAGVRRALRSANHKIMMDYSPFKLLLSISYSSKF